MWGAFTTIGGQTFNRIAALGSSRGLTTVWNPNADSNVFAIALIQFFIAYLEQHSMRLYGGDLVIQARRVCVAFLFFKVLLKYKLNCFEEF
jgi:hypothetical protein